MNKSSKFFFLGLGFLVVFLAYFHVLDDFDQDLGRHLKLGEIIWQTKKVPAVNLFAYTQADYPVLDHHWGSQVIFYFLSRTFGVNFLGFFNFLLGAVAFGLIFVYLLDKTEPWLAFLGLVFLLPLLTDRIGVRPEIFANVLMAFLILLAFKKDFFQKAKWFLPVIFLFWANLHLSHLLGLVIAGLLLLAQVIEADDKRKKIIENLLVLIFSLAACWLTPWGPRGWLGELLILKNYGYEIVENKSWWYLFRHGGFSLVPHLAWGWLVLVLSFFISRRKPGVAEFFALLFLSLASFLMVRNEPFFFYIGLVSLTLNLEIIFKKKTNEVKALVVLLALVVVLSWFFWQYQKGRWQFGFGQQAGYQKGIDFFLAENLPGPIFNNFDIGGYLDYRLYPQFQVFVDNRPEAFPVSFFAEIYKPMQLDEVEWHQQEEKWGFQTIIWAYSDITDWSKSFLGIISRQEDWQMVYLDKRVVIYRLLD